MNNIFFYVQAMALNCIEAIDRSEKSHDWTETSFRQLTGLLSLAMKLAFKTHVKRVGYQLAKLTFYILIEFTGNLK